MDRMMALMACSGLGMKSLLLNLHTHRNNTTKCGPHPRFKAELRYFLFEMAICRARGPFFCDLQFATDAKTQALERSWPTNRYFYRLAGI
jgi:hypothetical protein